MNHSDEHIQRWLRTQPDAAAQPPDALVEHVAGCAACRGALLVLMTSLLEAPPAQGIACEQCQEDLAAYIDAELAGGPRQAVRAYPEVWWHLWTCQDCAETYRVTLAIVSDEDLSSKEATARNQLDHVLTAARAWLFELPRAILNLTFDPGPLLVAMGDEDDTPTVLLDREQDGHRVVLSVQPAGEGQWSALVEVYPPSPGVVSLELDAARYADTLDPHGRAQLHGLPTALLTALDGPGVRLRIEPGADGQPAG